MEKVELSVNQKAIALHCLDDSFRLEINPSDGIWSARFDFISIGTIKTGATNVPVGRGDNPEIAIENLWDVLGNISENNVILKDNNINNTEKIRWNGFMWTKIDTL